MPHLPKRMDLWLTSRPNIGRPQHRRLDSRLCRLPQSDLGLKRERARGSGGESDQPVTAFREPTTRRRPSLTAVSHLRAQTRNLAMASPVKSQSERTVGEFLPDSDIQEPGGPCESDQAVASFRRPGHSQARRFTTWYSSMYPAVEVS